METFNEDLVFENYWLKASVPLVCLKSLHWTALRLFPSSVIFTHLFPFNFLRLFGSATSSIYTGLCFASN